MRSSHFFLLFFFGLGVAGPAAEIRDSGSLGKAARLDQVVAHYQQYGYFNGAILVADHGGIIYERGVGFADMAARRPNTPQTKFGIASITKQFTAVLVLQQASEGRLRLGAAITDYLPWYRPDTGKNLTIERLLHHTSGLPSDFNSPAFSDDPAAAEHDDPLPFGEKFCQSNLAAEPGQRWQYSNCGYVLLGLILEKVTGKTFEDLLHERILQPLEMRDTGMDRNDLVQLGGAQGYKRLAGPRYAAGPYLDRGHIFSAGAMYSTVEDLYRWSRALTSASLVPAEMRAQIFAPGLNDWAYGWFVTKIPSGAPGAGSTLEEMRGDLPGNYFSWMLRYPEQDSVIIVLRNAYGSTENFEGNLQAVLFDQPPHLPRRSPKDLFARLWQLPAYWAVAHPAFAAALFIAFAFALFAARRFARRRTPEPPLA